MVAAGAIGWNYTQLSAIREEIARIDAGPSRESLQVTDTKMMEQVVELHANQIQVMHRLDRIEDILRDGSRHGP